MRRIRIFISSPGDVAEERGRARQVIEQLQHWYGPDRVRLEAVLWEDLPLQFDSSFQQGIDAVLSSETGLDIAVFILWSRLGSPLGGPLRRSNGAEYRSGTEREFDLMLAARAASCGKRPALLAYVRTDDEGFHHRLKGKSPEELKALVAQLENARSFVQENFKDAEGHNLRAYHSFDAPVGFARRLKVHLRSLIDELLSDEAPAAARWSGPPYRGLETFDLDDAAIFFGREREACDVEEALRCRQQREGLAFLCIVGASGAGKSSLARAGVAASLAKYNLDESVAQWRIATLVPRQADAGLAEAVAHALWRAVPELDGRGIDAQALGKAFAADPAVAIDLSLRPALQTAGKAHVLLIIDQLEEIYTAAGITEDARRTFWRALEVLARSGVAWVLATLRSDFYAQAQRDEAFLRLKGVDGHYDLTAPSVEGLAALISQPAALAGLRFEKSGQASLEARILEEAVAQRDALPLLEYLLTELYLRRTAEGVLTVQAYVDIGGVAGAIGRRAEAVFTALDEPTQASLPKALRRLVFVQANGVVTARPARRAAFAPGTPEEALVSALTRERLLIAEENGDSAQVRVTHEALLSRWSRARQLIEADRERLVARSRVEEAYNRWVARDRPSDLLLPRGLPLAEAESLAGAWRGELDAPIRGYVDASRAHLRRRQRIVRAAVGIATLFLLALATLATASGRRATAKLREAQIAQSRFLTELASRQKNPRLAVLLALEALPVGEERPLVAESLHALPRYERGIPSVRLRYVDAVRTQDEAALQLSMSDFGSFQTATFSPDGARLFTLSSHQAALWDAVSWKRLRVFDGAEAVFSRDGEFVLTHSGHDVQIRDTASGKMLQDLSHASDVLTAAFSDDGKRVVTGSASGMGVVWDVATGKQLRLLPHEMAVRVALFSADGRKILTRSSQKQHHAVTIWDVVLGTELRVLPGFEAVRTATFSPDGELVLTVAKPLKATRSEAALWDTATGKQLRVFEDQASILNAIFSPDGDLVATSSEHNTVALWDATSGKRLHVLQGEGRVGAVSFSPDGARLVTASDDGTLKVWDVASGKEIWSLAHEDEILEARFSPDGRRIVTTSYKTVNVWVLPFGTRLQVLEHRGPVRSVAFSPDGKLLATASADETAALWDVASGERLHLFPHEDDVSTAIFSPDGKRLVTASSDKTAALWNADSGEQLRVLRHDRAVRSAAFSPDGTRVLTTSFDGDAALWDADSGKKVRVFPDKEPPGAAALSPDGSRVVTVSSKRAVLWDTDSGRQLRVFERPDDLPVSIFPKAAFTSDGTRLLTVFGLEPALWDVISGERFDFSFHGSTWDLAISADNKLVATASGDTAELWNVASRKQLEDWHHQKAVVAVAFSPDSTQVATASADKTAALWDVSLGKQLAVLPHDDRVWRVAYSPDGRHVATACVDGMAALWAAPAAQSPREYIDSVRAKVRAIGWCLTNEERTERFLPPMAAHERMVECR